MDFTLGLVIGLVIGLMLNWVIQPLAGRFGRSATNITGLNETLSDLSVRLAALENTVGGGTPAVLSVTEASGVARVFVENEDPLEEITGIGPVIAARFNAAGIYTFAELASISPERAKEIAATKNWQKTEPEKWIREAQALAKANRGGVADGAG